MIWPSQPSKVLRDNWLSLLVGTCEWISTKLWPHSTLINFFRVNFFPIHFVSGQKIGLAPFHVFSTGVNSLISQHNGPQPTTAIPSPPLHVLVLLLAGRRGARLRGRALQTSSPGPSCPRTCALRARSPLLAGQSSSSLRRCPCRPLLPPRRLPCPAASRSLPRRCRASGSVRGSSPNASWMR